MRPDRSQPSRNKWFFLYTVTITNEGTEPVQLLTRHWIITDGTGQVEEVQRPGRRRQAADPRARASRSTTRPAARCPRRSG